MLKKLPLLFTLLFFYGTGWCQEDFYLKKIDSLTQANTKTIADTIRIKNLNNISLCYGVLGDTKNGNDYAQKAMALAKKTHWDKGIVNAYIAMASQPGANISALLDKALKQSLSANDKLLAGDVCEIIGNTSQNNDQKLQYYNKALNYYTNVGNVKKSAGIFIHLAAVYEAKGMYFEAIDYRMKYLRLAEKNKDTVGMIDGNRYLALTYMNKGDKEKALQYYKATLKIAGSANGSRGFMLEINLEIGQIYFDKKDYPTALQYFNSALEYTGQKDEAAKRVTVFLNISKVYNQLHTQKAKQYLEEAKKLADTLPLELKIQAYYSVADAVYNAGDYSEAVRYYQFIVDMVNLYSNQGGLPLQAQQAGFYGLGISYLSLAKQQNNDKALLKKGIENLEKALPLYKQTNTLSWLEKTSYYLAEAYELTGRYQKSLSLYKEYLTYKDSLTSIERENAFVKKEAAFEYSQKENALKTKQKTALEHEQIQRNYAYAGIGIFVFISIGAGVAYSRKRKDNHIIASEKKRSDDLLLNILPHEVAEELKTKGEAGAKYYDHVSILFTDFVGFTKLSEKFSPEELIGELNYCFKAFDEIITRHNIEKIKTIGDSYMAVSGLPAGNDNHALNAVNAAIEMRNFIENYKMERSAQGRVYFEMRTGINSGQVVAGIVGIKKFAYDVWGDAVNIASRMESNGAAGKINISESTFELVKEHYDTEYRGELEAKGKGEIKMYFVEPKSNGWT